jgi:hypothetical protein
MIKAEPYSLITELYYHTPLPNSSSFSRTLARCIFDKPALSVAVPLCAQCTKWRRIFWFIITMTSSVEICYNFVEDILFPQKRVRLLLCLLEGR